MLHRYLAEPVVKRWTEDLVDGDTGEIIQIERSDLLFKRGELINHDVLESLTFYQQSGDIGKVAVSNQKRTGTEESHYSLCPYRASVRTGGKRKVFMLYADSVGMALDIIRDYAELHCEGFFFIYDIKGLDYFTSVNGPQDESEEEQGLEGHRNYYQISARIVMTDPDGKDDPERRDGTFLAYAVNAQKANEQILGHLLAEQERRIAAAEEKGGSAVKRKAITSYIEESKIIPIGCFIPMEFSEAWISKEE